MGNIDIFKLVLTSSFLGGIVSSLINWLIIPRISFRNEYFKKIIEKRIDAYESANELLVQFQALLYNNKKDTFIATAFWSIEKFNETIIILNKANTKKFWLDKKTSDALFNLGAYIVATQAYLLQFRIDDIPSEYIKNEKAIAEYRVELEKAIVYDFKNMHKIKDFWLDKNKVIKEYTI